MITSGPKLSVTTIDLTNAGSFTIEEAIGYFHVWRFEYSDGSLTSDGLISVQFGGPYNSEPLKMGYNGKVELAEPVSRTTISWTAQYRRVQLLTAGDAKGLNTTAPAARTIANVSGSLNVGSATVGTTATLLIGVNSSRQRGVIQAPSTNLSVIEIGNASLTLGSGIRLDPGDSFVVGANYAAVYAIAGVSGNAVRFWEEY